MLQVQNIEKYYGSKNNVTKALDRVSFDVEAGEFLARFRREREMAGKLGITDILTKFPYQVSGGQKQRAACARAMVAGQSSKSEY
jgi:ABC-type lipoprotein export system ATPase subunit